ncbi:B-box zinc finger protein [Edaphobacter albus]|uniref:B-box zinc finger protein n=1 Tax=Edaphobacter sp. 4G125 TaxID=2763071 RepID=UPI001648BFF4|nr:B-box zinc finger protein [Edaphobacter sp. 4G125]QNI37448.1 B-box zinc finger protein [Edaphobacter sp. 4G125]
MNCANHPERERIAFCQNCGKALCQECARVVGTAVFCEPCLEARISGGSQSSSYTPPPTGAPGAPAGQPPSNGEPNPGLAALLGFIPGVGAMYNGQYAKGIVHLIIFAVLVSLSDEHGIFGLFVAGWVIYQVFEAYQTARARRDGTALPNPFGFNDLGDRLGFGKSWPSSQPASGTTASEVPPAAPYTPPAASYPPPGATWGAPADTFTGGSPYNTPYSAPYVVTPPAFDPNAGYPRNRFPAGAIWLIGLGALFLVGNVGLFHGFPVQRLFPFFLIGLGVWLFVHKMTSMGGTLADDGTAFYRVRLFTALRGSIWVILVGVLFLLSSFDILSWGRSWPLFIIVAGVMILAEKTMYNPASGAPVYPPVPPATPPVSTSIVPPTQDNSTDQEGR